MSVRVERIKVPQPERQELRIVESTCDRCGAPALCGNNSARQGFASPGPWGEVDILAQGTSEVWHADLCRPCTLELHTWLDAGDGRGMVTLDQVAREIHG